MYTNDIFELASAKDWKLVNEQGTDSYVGYYFKAHDTIRFDCGWYGFGTLDEIKAEPNTFHFEEIEIDHCPSKIKGSLVGKNRWWYAFIQKQNDSMTKNVLYIKNPSNESEIIKIFKSHRFKK
jgi:hypothetical protein